MAGDAGGGDAGSPAHAGGGDTRGLARHAHRTDVQRPAEPLPRRAQLDESCRGARRDAGASDLQSSPDGQLLGMGPAARAVLQPGFGQADPACLPANTIEQSELESVPFSRFSKSVGFTFAQLAISVAYGCRGTTINIFDHLGTPMEAEPHYGRMLGERKPFLNALGALSQQPGVFRGIQLIHRDNASCGKQLAPGDGLTALAEDGYQGMEAFEAAGIPTTYDPSEVVLLTGQQPRA